MHREIYRGYTLDCNEKVDIGRDGEHIDQVDSLAEAAEIIDGWLAAP